ncbi:MAG TPA: AsmA-like C-terminal region-containing protein, partial [Terriglobales bacterium]
MASKPLNISTLIRKTPIPRWAAILAGILAAILASVVLFLAVYAEPYLHRKSEDMLSSRFRSEVQIEQFHISLFPLLSLRGTGIVLRHHGRTDVPPLLSIAEFSANASLRSMFGKPWHIQKVRLKGLTIQIPPRERRGKLMGSSASTQKRDIEVKIDELISDDAELDILPGKPEKSPHQFLIHHLRMRDIGPGHGAPFEATLTNATPPGEIHVKGELGPWQRDEPRRTPLSAEYTFQDADLSVFKGISGILSSQGKFGGVLESIEVQGETATPDFTVNTGGHPMMLKTEFNATVDGTDGDTLLHPVVAHIGNSTLICNGGVVKPRNGKRGKEVVLEVTSNRARLDDLLRLAVKSDQPPLTGRVNMRTKFDLPPGPEDVINRLELDGRFGIGDGEFTDPKVREKIEGLSRRGQGRPKDEEAGDAVSQLKGNFKLRDGVITLRNLHFAVTGANVQLDGTYGIRSERLDFHGKLHLQAKVSQTTTGIKSFLLKAVDPFFRKNGVTEIPIKVTGT